MKYCSNCGKQLADDDAFCSGCGLQTGTAAQPQVVVCAPVTKRKGAHQVWATLLHTLGSVMMIGGVIAVIVVVVLALLGAI